MKNNYLLNLLGCSNIIGYNLFVKPNVMKMDFSSKNHLQVPRNSNEEFSKKKNGISNFLLLLFFSLFTNFLFAQQPACNLKGILVSRKASNGGTNFTITPDIHNAVPGTIYKWEFTSNASGASFVSESNLPTLTINPGDINGDLDLMLTLTNPATANRESRTCSCTKSVSIGN